MDKTHEEQDKVNKYLSSFYESSDEDVEKSNDGGRPVAKRQYSVSHPISDSDSDNDTKNHDQPLRKTPSKKQKISPESSNKSKGHSRDFHTGSPVCKVKKQQSTDTPTPKANNDKKCRAPSPKHTEKERKRKDARPSSPTTSSSGHIPNTSQKVDAHELSSFAKRLNRASPLCYFLTKIHAIPESARTPLSLGILDLLDPSLGKIKEELQLNYMVDVEWLYEAHKRKGQCSHPITILHGEQDENSRKEISLQASMYDNVTVHRVVMPFAYGTHHTKMMIFQYEEGLRVVVHTSNMIQRDWMNKTQGTWVSHLCPLLPPSAQPFQGESSTGFKKDLLSYLSVYRMPALTSWISKIKRHDFSGIRVFFVASVPGRHAGPVKDQFGHMYLRKILQNHATAQADWPVIMQCSSIGSLGASKDDWLESEFLTSLAAAKSTVFGRKPPLKLVFPHVNDVRESIDGYMSGSSIPYSRQTHFRQQWLQRYMHCWKSEHRGRSRAMPHIKTYTRLSPSASKVAWFLLTSANLSKAAWGAVQKKDSQYFIRSYEAGVLFLPDLFEQGEDFSLIKGNAPQGCGLSLPYDVPLQPYGSGNSPWLVDNTYKRPDSLGNTWPPS